jgi:RNAse (barnase) inhibitor barstar
MPSLLELLPDSQRAGVYQTDLATQEIIAAANTLALHVAKIDLRRIHGKAELLDAFAKAMQFPNYFGKNWDALSDCLIDLSWLSNQGWVLILANGKNFSQTAGNVLDTTLAILSSASIFWRTQGKPFWAFVEVSTDWEIDLPKVGSD